MVLDNFSSHTIFCEQNWYYRQFIVDKIGILDNLYV